MNPVSRFGTALREMRWAQVLIELALLIAGILVALAVDGWIEDRRDARLEQEYLGRLERDLDQNLDILNEFVEFEGRQVADGVLVYRALCGADAADVRSSRRRSATSRTVAPCGWSAPPTRICSAPATSA